MPIIRIAVASALLLTLVAVSAAPAQVIEVPQFALGVSSGIVPQVTTGTDGTVAVGWGTSVDETANAKRFTAAGVQLGLVHRVDVSGKVREATISAAPQGGYYVAWHRRPFNKRSAIFARRLDASGVPLGSETEVSDGDPLFPEVPTIAALPSGAVVVWRKGPFLGRILDTAGNPRELFEVGTGDAGGGSSRAIAALPDGGFVIVWRAVNDGRMRFFNPSGLARGDALAIGNVTPQAVAVNPGGTMVVVSTGGSPNGVRLQRFDLTGTPIGGSVLVAEASAATGLAADAGIDALDNVYVAWTRYDFLNGGGDPIAARAYDAADQPLGPAIDVGGSAAFETRVATLPNGRFFTVWRQVTTGVSLAAVVSLCAPGAAVCGDGTQHPQCELCDDGAANSDTLADACRTDCRPAYCGDGVTDSGEECDDGNTDVCDGCTATCQAEPGIVCGDGITQPNCGETCDDGNGIAGDGCAPSCDLERVPGGGAPPTDCYTVWSVDNPTNAPFLDGRGNVNLKQRCVDGNAACDHDGVAGSCTFHVKVCANNEGMHACTPPNRLASWSLDKPSATQAANDAGLAAVRDALASVPGTIVGPSTQNICTPELAVVVPMRGGPGAYKTGKLALRTHATSYDDTSDTDKLQLSCAPPS